MGKDERGELRGINDHTVDALSIHAPLEWHCEVGEGGGVRTSCVNLWGNPKLCGLQYVVLGKVNGYRTQGLSKLR